MPLSKLLLPPDEANYSFEAPNEVLSVELDGGLSRTRLDKIGSATKVTVQWTAISVYNFNYLMAFFRTGANRGATPFLIDLILDGGDPAEYTAKFVSLSVPQVQGLGRTVTAVLEVVGNPPSSATDATTIANGPNLA